MNQYPFTTTLYKLGKLCGVLFIMFCLLGGSAAGPAGMIGGLLLGFILVWPFMLFLEMSMAVVQIEINTRKQDQKEEVK